MVKVLALNPGSSSLKCELLEMPETPLSVAPSGEVLWKFAREQADFSGAVLAEALSELPAEPALIACRVVHGGDLYRAPVRVDERVRAVIERLDDLAPLHNRSSLAILRSLPESALREVPAFAVFDTAFHSTIPEVASRYAIDRELADRHGIRRYGFHGISHRYLMLRYCEITGTPVERANLITLHLGGGASAAAIRNGCSIDTSMGFTPLEGLIMGTRCGDLDPAIVGYLARREAVDIGQVEAWLNKRSGLLGLSGISPDTRVLVEDAGPRARGALESFAYRIKKYIGAYSAVVGDPQAVVFSGGIGENTPLIRELACAGLEGLGLHFDALANERAIGVEARITHPDARLHAYVIPTRESLMMAAEALLAYGPP